MFKCVSCDIEMVESKFISQAAPGLEPYISFKPSNFKLGGEKRSKVICHVCPDCGKIELRAANIDIFK